MRILFFCTRWGSEDIPWPEFCAKIKAAGYDGVEAALPREMEEHAAILAELKNNNLEFIAVEWAANAPDFPEYVSDYKMGLRWAALAKPLFITAHTGKDFFTPEQTEQLLTDAKKMSGKYGVKIIHETHRGKFSFAAHVTKAYLDKLPWLRLTLDISHWFAVAESYLENQPDAVEQALQHTDHIHARIGYVNGPQVSDPRSPEWAGVVEKHLALWDKVVELHRNIGSEYLTFTTEFGPAPYMQLKPFSNDELANQWEVNEYMLNLLKKRYH